MIYDHPKDYPEHFAVRAQHCSAKGVRHDQSVFLARDLDEARAAVPPGSIRIDRDPNDDPVIVESWV